MYYLFIILISIAVAAALTVASVKLLQTLQLSSYRANGVIEWFKATKYDYLLRYFSVAFFATVSMIVYVGCFSKYRYVEYLGLIFFFASVAVYIAVNTRIKQKTPLKFTPRMIRLTLMLFLLCAGEAVLLMLLERKIIIRYALIGILPFAIPLNVFAAHYIMLPLETFHKYTFKIKATKKLKSMPSLIKIGITGSFGKTTAKNILSAMLSYKYKVYATPESYNTPMGICRAVGEGLTADTEIFIAEMGARHNGDIDVLCKIVSPDIGVVTAIGSQHLKTFGSIENIVKTKYELIKGLSGNGFSAFSADNVYTREMYGRTDGKKLLAGENGDDCAVTYQNTSISSEGTEFELNINGAYKLVNCKLLGRHIPSLVSLCAAVAYELGVPAEDIFAAVDNMPCVEHRLQVIKRGEVTVIDDAYNSNELGYQNALEVLKEFNGAHIVITPGLVELGESENKINERMGSVTAKYADYAMFLGGRAQHLKEGALSGGMSEDRVFMFASTRDAVEKCAEISGEKTILFENDLPDNL